MSASCAAVSPFLVGACVLGACPVRRGSRVLAVYSGVLLVFVAACSVPGLLEKWRIISERDQGENYKMAVLEVLGVVQHVVQLTAVGGTFHYVVIKGEMFYCILQSFDEICNEMKCINLICSFLRKWAFIYTSILHPVTIVLFMKEYYLWVDVYNQNVFDLISGIGFNMICVFIEVEMMLLVTAQHRLFLQINKDIEVSYSML